MVVGHIVARVGSSRLVVGPCILCSLRSGVALAPEILFFAPLSIVTKQEPQKTKQARNLKASTITATAKKESNKSLPSFFLPTARPSRCNACVYHIATTDDNRNTAASQTLCNCTLHSLFQDLLSVLCFFLFFSNLDRLVLVVPLANDFHAFDNIRIRVRDRRSRR